MRRTLIALTLACLMLSGSQHAEAESARARGTAAGDSVAKQRSFYVPRQGKACRKGYRRGHRVLHGKRVRVCIKKKRPSALLPTPTAEPLSFRAYLDPTIERDPFNPYRVIYGFGAAATGEKTGTPLSLPAGVLSLYSNGSLECAVNVGGAASSSRCAVTYPWTFGPHRIDVIYTSGERSVTVGQTVSFGPLATSTQLGVGYADHPPRKVWGAREWEVGTLEISGSVQPKGTPPVLTCFEDDQPNCFETGAWFTDAVIELPVFARIDGISTTQATFQIKEPKHNGLGNWRALSDFETGLLHLYAIGNPGEGYVTSYARTPLAFSPQTFPDVYFAPETSIAATSDWQKVLTVGTYEKLTPKEQPLEVVASFVGFQTNEGCRFQVRANGVTGPEEVETGSIGFTTQEASIFQVEEGPTEVEVWARYLGEEEDPTCRLQGRFVVSE